MAMKRGLVTLLSATAGMVVGLGMAAERVHAHGAPVSLADWGSFPADAARCQRGISRAAATCVNDAVAVRTACVQAQLAGDPCDDEATAAQITAIRQRALEAVEAFCSHPQLLNLRYVDMSDAQTDVIAICRDLDTASISAVFGPALIGGSVAEVDTTTATCLSNASVGAAKLARLAFRARQRALDRIASGNLSAEEKQALVDRAEQRIARARGMAAARINATCPPSRFTSLYNRDAASFLDGIGKRADCLSGSVYVQDAVVCPPAVCGNGMQESGEECDDGNDFEGDACGTDCVKSNCAVFPSTYDLIQQAIFENHGCTTDLCHGAGRAGDLDLRAGASYENLIDVPSSMVPGFKRIDPGNKDNSLLWINVAAATLPEQYQAPLRAMPLGLPPLSDDEVEALRIWIETGGAARTGAVPATAELLEACLPEPIPGQIEPLPPPAPHEGIQMHMPAWTLEPNSESEVCFSSYYDFTGKVPAEFLSTDGKSFRYKEVEIRQDPLSHHLIVDLFRGDVAPNAPIWGPYTCKAGPRAGASCDPLDLGFCGEGGDCATDPDPTTIACIGFGPQTGLNTLTSGGFAFAQETTSVFRFPGGVYDELPLKGTVLWNSHAFNLTRRPGDLEGWVNIYFPEPQEQQFRQVQIFDVSRIFWNDLSQILTTPRELAPFERMEVCNIHVFGQLAEPFFGSLLPPTQTAHVFELSGHMHRRGKRFQIFRGYFSCAGGQQDGDACSPLNPDTCPDGTCSDTGGRSAEEALLYTNLVYNDPVVLRFPDPLLIAGAAPIGDRSLTFCGIYDNGTAPNIADVKRLSTSPPPGTIFGFEIGGPCGEFETRCIGGAHHNEACFGDNSRCDSATGAGDGDCDACPLTGGFRTEDEMFILFGNFWTE